MRALLRPMRPDSLRGHLGGARALPSGPDGGQQPHRLRRLARTASRSHADPPRAGRAARRDPRRDLRPGRLPGAGAGDRRKVAGYSLGQADLLRRAMGKKKTRGAGRPVSKASRDGMQSPTATPSARSRRCGTPCSRSATTASTSPIRPATGWCPTGRRTSRRTTRPSTWPLCSPACAATRTSRRSTSTSAGGWASRCCRPTSTSRRPTSRRSARDIRFGLSAIRNVGANVVARTGRGARATTGKFTDFGDFLTRCLRSSATSGCSSRCARPARSTRSATPGAPWSPSTTEAVDQYVDLKRNEEIGQDSLFGGLDEDFSAHLGRGARRWRSGTRSCCSRSSATCSASTSPTTRSPGSSTCWPQASDVIDRPAGRSTTSREEGAIVTVAGLITSVVRKTTKKGDLYAVVTVEDLEGAVNVMVFPRDYQLSSTLLVEDSVVTVKGKIKRSRDDALELTCHRDHHPRPDPRRRRPADRHRDAGGAGDAAGRRAAQGRAVDSPGRRRGASASCSRPAG